MPSLPVVWQIHVVNLLWRIVHVANPLATRLTYGKIDTFFFSSIFILLSRESDQCATRARLGVASHLSTTPRWGNPANCLS